MHEAARAILIVVFVFVSGCSAGSTSAPAVGNHPPVAGVGSDRGVAVGSVVTLNGSTSSDADGNALTYDWIFASRPADSTAAFDDPTDVTPTFTADHPGDYVVELTVSDGSVSATASVTITATFSGANQEPVAVAGSNTTVTTGTVVSLDGSASSDPESASLTYNWLWLSLPVGSTASFSDAASVSPTFTADVSGAYVAELTVFDGVLFSDPSVVVVTASVTGNNLEPIADAGSNSTVVAGTLVTLNGSASSDPESAPLSYLWLMVSQPATSAASLTDPSSATPSFTADLPGSYVVELTVHDGEQSSDPDIVVITASSDSANQPPVVEAGPDLTVEQGSVVTLNGLGSSDPEGAAISYTWIFATRPVSSVATFSDASSATPSFTVDRAGTYTISLTVSDGALNSIIDTVTITATAATGNRPPVADAGADQFAVRSQTWVTLDTSASSDPDNDALSYLWVRVSHPAGSTAALNINDPAAPTFLPDRDGEFVFQLLVTDGAAVSAWDEVSIFSASAADITLSAGSGQSGVVGEPLAVPISVTVTNDYGMPVRFVTVSFAVTAGGGSVSSTGVSTNSSGISSTTLTLGTGVGVNTVTATCSSCTASTQVTVDAQGTPDVAAGIVINNPGPVTVGTLMQLEVSLVDQYGNTVTTDSSTQVDVVATGAGAVAFDSAVEGTIDSGAGTAAARITFANGHAVIAVSNDTAEVVAFDASDPGATLAFYGHLYSASGAVQPLVCNGASPGNIFVFDLTGVGTILSDATVDVHAQGDLNASFETITVYMEDRLGANHGVLFTVLGGCTLSTDSLTIPLADMQTYAADASVGMELVTAGGASCSCSQNTAAVDISMQTQPTGEFL